MDKLALRQYPEVKRVVTVAFPSYRKLHAYVSTFPEHGMNINSYWDGGSKREYALVELATMQRKVLPTSTHPFFEIAERGLANQHTTVVETDHVGNITLKMIPEGYALVESGTFCGKPATAHIYINAANFAKALGVPNGTR